MPAGAGSGAVGAASCATGKSEAVGGFPGHNQNPKTITTTMKISVNAFMQKPSSTLRLRRQVMNPRYPFAKLPENRERFGNTVPMFVPLTPNHLARVAAY